MQDTYLESNNSSIAGISDAGNVKGDPNFKNAVRRQATMRVHEKANMPGLALGVMLLNSADKYCTTPFHELPAELERLKAGGIDRNDPRYDEVA